ncbi:MAG: hypothetical protein [Bacteriophage sp.]|nr:MAG: hypothetical protein [Bacteriophage sp.]
MQDINQQLYENKSTPEGFIPVYGVVVTVPTRIYINGQKEFTCDKTFDEVKEILLKGGSIIAVDNNNSRINFDRIDIGNNSISATITYFSSDGGGINKIDLSWDKGLTRVGGEETKSINTFVAINSNSIINRYNIDTIINKILDNAADSEVLAAINNIFTNFGNFVTAICNPNSVFYNDAGNFSLRYSGDVVVIVWNADTYIGHITINNEGAYTYNTIQIVDQTLYRLSKLTIDPIVNPKIWVGTATQYAAIAQKDNNTTYIVKSDV